MDVIAFAPAGTVITTLTEFDRLRKVEHDFRKYLDDSEAVIIGGDWYNSVRVINAKDYHTQLLKEVKSLEKQLKELRGKKVPMFNMPGKTVIEL